MGKNSRKTSKEISVERLFGQVLQQLRKRQGLSQEELGFESGYHRTYISLLERGQKSPSLQTIFKISKALKVEPSDILLSIQNLAIQKVKKKK